MTYSFQNISAAPAARRFLREDWSKEEAAFSDSVHPFRASIETGNVVVAPYMVDPGRWPKREKDEEKSQIRQEAAHVPVESTGEKERLGIQCHGNPAPQPAQPKESAVPQPDSLDDLFFQPVKPAQATRPPDPVAGKAAPSADPFDFAPASSAQAFPEAPAGPAPAPLTTTPAASAPEPSGGIMEGFDLGEFAETKRVADKILADTGDVDLGQIVDKIPEYAVKLDLDAHRENPNVLADSLVEIQAKKDSVHSDLLKVSPIVDSLKGAIDYILDVGIQCSKQSSREKRIAQVKHEISDLITRHAIMERVRDVLDMTYRHLVGQNETVSRLITWHMQFPKTLERSFMSMSPLNKGDMSKGAGGLRAQPAVQPAQVPVAPIASQSRPKAEIDESLFGGLEAMPAEPKMTPKPDKFSKGEIDW